MKVVAFEDLKRLEEITCRIEKVTKPSKIADDIRWLCNKLREAFKIIEKISAS